MSAQGILNIIFGVLMVVTLVAGASFLLARACDKEWEFVIGAVIGVIMTVVLYGFYMLSNLPNT